MVTAWWRKGRQAEARTASAVTSRQEKTRTLPVRTLVAERKSLVALVSRSWEKSTASSSTCLRGS
jgi:hypothetical protein